MSDGIATRQGQVSAQCQRLEKAIAVLYEDIEHLEGSLSLILSLTSPQGEEKGPDGVLVPHAEFLAKMTKRVERASEWLRTLRERIEL